MALNKEIKKELDIALDEVLTHATSKEQEKPKSPNKSRKKNTISKTKSIDTIPVYTESEFDTTDLEELNSLIGLESVKKEVVSLMQTIAINNQRRAMNLNVPEVSNHLVFSGNPGTGKTTVARIIAELYQKLGVVSKGQLIETDRTGLVAGYVGQTALKTNAVIQSALGGVLFIDEAYTLSSGSGENDFGQEAIDTLLKAMEDNRNDLVVIVAGYPELMSRFIESNPGLKSRFNKFIFFEDYSPEELKKIFLRLCQKNDYSVSASLDALLLPLFENVYQNRTANFANAREVRNIFENTIQRQATRLFSQRNHHLRQKEMMELLPEDLDIRSYSNDKNA